MSQSEATQRGEAIRRKIVGADLSDRIATAGGDLRNELAAAATEHFWGAFWTRPELDQRSRSILTIAMLITGGNRWKETLALHLRSAVRNRLLTMEEIRELILHSAVYVGYPAASAAMRVAQGVFSDPKDGGDHEE